MEEKHILSRFKELLVDFPALVKLLYRLLRDPRVSKLDKAILGGIVVYILNPVDVLPDAIPLIGQIDDAYLLALALLRLLNRTDAAVLAEHWEGRYEIIPLLEEITELAVFYLPEKTRNLLVGRLDKAGSAK